MLGALGSPSLMHSETFFQQLTNSALSDKFCQTELGILGSYNPFYVRESTRSSKVKSAFALVCRCYANNLEEHNLINRQIRIVSHFQTFECDECHDHFADFNVPCQCIIQPNSFYYWAG